MSLFDYRASVEGVKTSTSTLTLLLVLSVTECFVNYSAFAHVTDGKVMVHGFNVSKCVHRGAGS